MYWLQKDLRQGHNKKSVAEQFGDLLHTICNSNNNHNRYQDDESTASLASSSAAASSSAVKIVISLDMTSLSCALTPFTAQTTSSTTTNSIAGAANSIINGNNGYSVSAQGFQLEEILEMIRLAGACGNVS